MTSLMFILPVLLATFLGAVYLYITKNNNYWKKRNVHFIQPKPIVGSLGSVVLSRKSIGDRISELHKQSDEPFSGFFTFNQPSLLVRDLDLIKNVLIRDFSYFMDRSFSPDVHVDPLASEGLFSLKGDRWRKLRMKLTPSFTTGKMKNMFYLVLNCAKQMDPLLDRYADSSEDFDAKNVMVRFTTDVISTCAFGLDGNSLLDPDSEFLGVGRAVFQPNLIESMKQALAFFGPKFLTVFSLKLWPDTVYNFIRKIIWSAVEYREKNAVFRNDFLDLLMELRKETTAEHKINPSASVLDGDALVAQTLGFFLASSETSSTAMSLTLYELALHQDIQIKLRKTIRTVLSKYGGEITYESVQEMTYLHQVVSETLRKYPSLPFLDRLCVAPYQIPGTDVAIEPGIKVFISLMSIQNDPKIFPNPTKFDPDRFTEDKIAERNKLSYIPFGEGPRSCIGMRFGLIQAKVGLVYLLRNYTVEPCKNTPIPLKFNKKSFVLTCQGGTPLTLKKCV